MTTNLVHVPLCEVSSSLQVLDQCGVDSDDWARIRTNGFVPQRIAEIMSEARCHKLVKEEAPTKLGYPKNHVVQPLDEQVKTLASTLKLCPDKALKFIRKLKFEKQVLLTADGWFAVPTLKGLARVHFPQIQDPVECYCRATQLILEILKPLLYLSTTNDGRPLEQEITPEKFLQQPRTSKAMDFIQRQQEGDIVILPAQFGLRHKGRSVLRTREVFLPHEFGLDVLMVGAMLITHPARLKRPTGTNFSGVNQPLGIHCLGNQYNFQDNHPLTPVFYFFGNNVFYNRYHAVAFHGFENYGAATGFMML